MEAEMGRGKSRGAQIEVHVGRELHASCSAYCQSLVGTVAHLSAVQRGGLAGPLPHGSGSLDQMALGTSALCALAMVAQLG